VQKALSTFAALCLLCAVAAGAPISINTGVAGWTVGGSAVANVTNDPNWAAAPVGSSWVTAPGGQLTPPFYHLGGNYTYTLSLSGLLGLPGELSFSISADNNYQVSFTDITCVGAGCTTANVWGNLTGPHTASLVASGPNPSMSVLVVNEPQQLNPTGLLLFGTLETVPEPSTWAILGIGMAAIATIRKKRKA